MKRHVFGIGVLVLGIAALGLWGSFVTAPKIENKVRSATEAALAAAGAPADLAVNINGRDIDVSGLAVNEGGSEAIVAALNGVEGRRVVRTKLEDLPVAAPFAMTARKDGALTAEGVVPNEQVRASLAPMLGDAANSLTLATGMPEGWAENAAAGAAALSLLQKGTLSVEGQTVVLVGEVMTKADLDAVDAALANVKMQVKDITVLDDGQPVAYKLDYTASGGAVLDGKLPYGITPESVAVALGLSKIGGNAKTTLLRETGDVSYLSAWAGVLPQLESLTAEATPAGRSVRAVVMQGADADAVRAALATGEFDVDLEIPPAPAPEPKPAPAPEPKAEPVQTPILDQVLPVMSALGFEISSTGCQGASDALLDQTTIVFLPNLDTLDASATEVLENLAAIARDCAGGSFKAEIGGHTDTSGDAAENLALSARRAEAVRAALIAAGVPEDQLTAKGYGSAQPIADNETKEGRAKNRRTTLVWSNK